MLHVPDMIELTSSTARLHNVNVTALLRSKAKRSRLSAPAPETVDTKRDLSRAEEEVLVHTIRS